jgi:hypothetical protein
MSAFRLGTAAKPGDMQQIENPKCSNPRNDRSASELKTATIGRHEYSQTAFFSVLALITASLLCRVGIDDPVVNGDIIKMRPSQNLWLSFLLHLTFSFRTSSIAIS